MILRPRITKVPGMRVWECYGCYYMEGGGMLAWVRGHGYTPQEAYDDWKAQQ